MTLAPNAPRAELVADLTSLAHDSRCGDTVIVFLTGYAFSIANSGLQFVLADITGDVNAEDENAYPSFLIPGSPAQREGRRIRGALDSSELLDYFDADAGHANRIAGRMRNDFASWHAMRTESESGGNCWNSILSLSPAIRIVRLLRQVWPLPQVRANLVCVMSTLAASRSRLRPCSAARCSLDSAPC